MSSEALGETQTDGLGTSFSQSRVAAGRGQLWVTQSRARVALSSTGAPGLRLHCPQEPSLKGLDWNPARAQNSMETEG